MALEQIAQILELATQAGLAGVAGLLIWALVVIVRLHTKSMAEIVKSFTERSARSGRSNGKP